MRILRTHFLPLALPSAAQSALDPLWRNDPWASAMALRPAQQNQVPTRPQQPQGSEVWTHSGHPTSWQTPRWPFELTGQNSQESRGSAPNDWQSSCSPPVPPPVPPPPTCDATQPGFASVDASRQDHLRSGWNLSGRGDPGFGQPTMDVTDRDPIPTWDFQEPGARLRPWLRELNFWRHDTSTPLHKHGV